ncbi:restriction endonuclease subunit S [Shewanella baltica]|uniref:restriction endonuclease subunit S n=1 Tax=Shewanella baltica TaxID=62322 RepID=UPI003D7A7C31
MADLSITNALARNIEATPTAKNLITTHLDIWTTAIEQKSSAGRGSSNKFSLYGIKKLRELILELAVRGKLVPQDVNDEPASVLLERIAAEKAQLVKDGKLKKQKPLPEIGEDEKPFELPQGWAWARFQDISLYIQRGKGPSYAEVGKVKVISQKCVQNTGFDMSPARYVTDESLEKYQPERFLINDDILWNSTGTGTVGRANVISNVDINSLVADSHVTVIRPLNIYSRFLWCFIMAPGIQSRIEPDNENALVSGSTNQVELNTSSVMSVVAPVAPLEEQHRIVAKVDELMSLCDALEAQTEASISAHQTLVETLLNALLVPQATANTASQSNVSLGRPFTNSFDKDWQRVVEHFDTLFTTAASIDTLKQTILQLAVMGKLVEQASSEARNSPDYEPAAKLLERIAKEKAQLIKEGKIKKQKPLPAITEEEKPFELPNGWEWVRLSEAGLGSTGKTPSTRNPDFYVGKIPFIGPGQIRPSGAILEAEKFLSPSGLINSSEALPGDIFMVCIGGSIGKAAIVTQRSGFNQQINCISPIKIQSRYLYFCLSTECFYTLLLEKATGSATPIINRGKWEELLIPIAPLEEQHRIVAKVDELMALCDQLKVRLADAQTTQLHLTDAIVEQAV